MSTPPPGTEECHELLALQVRPLGAIVQWRLVDASSRDLFASGVAKDNEEASAMARRQSDLLFREAHGDGGRIVTIDATKAAEG